jgi:spore germination cell wall hydrolase CwlJ-like protein
MSGKTLALLLVIVALTSAAGAARACSMNRSNASAEELTAVERNRDSLGIVRASPLHLAASAIQSWAHKINAVFNRRIVDESCLASAVYFEARSESLQGQLAVAMVVLNRVKTPPYPSTICGVVYQGAGHLNACQFSFACDGEPDLPQLGRAWDAALAVTALALDGGKEMLDEQMRIVSTATNYHADYVKPGWSKSLRRLTKIGRHIFYAQS